MAVALGAEGEDIIPALERARQKLHVLPSGRTKAKTVPVKRTMQEWRAVAAGEEVPVEYPEDVERPKTRGECGQARPCPFVSCSQNLYLDVSPETGAIKFNFPHLEPWEMAESCALDVADRAGSTLDEVGRCMNITRERARQVEVRGLAKIKKDASGELGLPPERAIQGGTRSKPHPHAE